MERKVGTISPQRSGESWVNGKADGGRSGFHRLRILISFAGRPGGSVPTIIGYAFSSLSPDGQEDPSLP
jgi:hypothetical protein